MLSETLMPVVHRITKMFQNQDSLWTGFEADNMFLEAQTSEFNKKRIEDSSFCLCPYKELSQPVIKDISIL